MQLKDPSLFRQQAYVNGRWVSADSGATFDVTDPATGECIARVADLGAAETGRAIAAAEVAQKAWAAQTGKARAAILRRWFDLMLANTDDLAYLMKIGRAHV